MNSKANAHFSPGDCRGALPLCGFYEQSWPIEGTGNTYELYNSCLRNVESRTLWFRFKVKRSGTFGFRIIPNHPQDNFDFALYDITSLAGFNCENTYTRPPERCNVSQQTGVTGLADSVYTPLGVILNEGLNGNPFMDGLFITQGQEFVLVINQTGIARGGFRLFTTGTALLTDEVPLKATLLEDTLCAGSTTHLLLTLSFNKRLDCSQVEASDFEISAENSTETFPIVRINCQEELVDIIFRTPTNFREGKLILRRKGIVPDLCSGMLLETQFPFWLTQFQNISITGAPNATCTQTPLQLGLSWRSQLPVQYRWNFGTGAAPEQFVGPIPPKVVYTTITQATVRVAIEASFCKFSPTVSTTIRITEPSPLPQWQENTTVRCGAGSFTVNFTTLSNLRSLRLYATENALLPVHIIGQSPWQWTTPSFSRDTAFWVEGVETNLGCISSRQKLSLKVHSIPEHPVYSITPLCAPGRPTLSFWGLLPNHRLNVYTSLDATVPLISTTFPQSGISLPSISQHTSFYVNVVSPQTGCQNSRQMLVAEVKNQPIPSWAYAGSILFCGGQVQTLSFRGILPNAILRLYSSLDSGQPMAIGSIGSNRLEWFLPEGNSQLYFEQWLPNQNCVSERLRQDFSVRPIPPIPLAQNVSHCSTEFVFRAELPSGLGLRLYDLPIGGTRLAQTFSPGQEGVQTPSIQTTTTFYLASFDPQTGCESPRSAVLAEYLPTAPPIPPIINLCRGQEVALSMSPAPGESLILYNATGSVLHVYTVNNPTFYTPFLSATTTYFIDRRIGNCQSVKVPWIIRVSRLEAPPYSSVQRCGAGKVTLLAQRPNFGATRVSLFTQTLTSEPIAQAEFAPFELVISELSTSTRFYIEAQDSLGCKSRSSVDVIIRPIPNLPGVPMAASVQVCPGQRAVFTIVPNPPLGESIRIYSMAEGGVPLAEIRSQPYLYTTFPITTTTTFYVAAAYDGQGCESSRRAIFATTYDLPPTPLESDFVVSSRCKEGFVTISVLKADYPILLSAIIGGQVLTTFTRTPASFNHFISTTTTFYLEAQDPRTGCRSHPLAIVAKVHNRLISPPVAEESILLRCGNGSVQFSFSGLSESNFTIKIYTQPSATTAIENLAFTPYRFTTPFLTTNTTFFASVYDEKSTCESARVPISVRLTVPDSVFRLSIQGSNSLVCGQAITLRANTNQPKALWQWLPTEAVASPYSLQTLVAPKQTVTYTLLGSYNGCVQQAVHRVEVATQNIIIREQTPNQCNGTPTLLSIEESITQAIWVPAEGLNRNLGNTVEATPTITTTYTVTGLKDGCRVQGSITVPVRLPLRLSVTTWPASSLEVRDGRIFIEPQGGTPPFSYTYEGLGFWQSSSTFNNLAVGTYNLIVRDRNGCRATATVNIVAQPLECSSVRNIQLVSLDYQQAQFQWNPVSGVAYYEYTLKDDQQNVLVGPVVTSENRIRISLPSFLRNFFFEVRSVCVPNFSFSQAAAISFVAPSCGENANLQIQSNQMNRVTLSWVASPEITRITIEYRRIDVPNLPWLLAYEGVASSGFYTLQNLIPNTLYELKFTPYCQDGYAGLPQVFSFRTAANGKLNGEQFMIQEFSQFHISPNPTQTYWKLTLPFEVNDLELRLYNLQGALLRIVQNELSTNEVILDGSELISGIYILELRLQNRYLVTRLVKN
ncbi:MAG: T9SS type A sorting domain-containing protein [Bacteroidia bacterium]|nr:T9SS type A sorting domain-containing protein [Bacteroidia bacterium]MDW8159258.1 T9SS type A sorting domain-containing protein [Bacteroidia bacterium]